MEVMSRVSVCDDADLIRDVDVVIDVTGRFQSAGVPKEIAGIFLLNDLLYVNARTFFNRSGKSNLTAELSQYSSPPF
jgi:hypothetical protein